MSLRRKRRLMGEINVVPYIDVMLVLLIIFMVTAPLLTQGVQVELPKVGGEPVTGDTPQDEPMVLSVDAQGRYYLNVGADPDQPIDEATVLARAAAMLQRRPGTLVLVKADGGVAYDRVVQGMVLLQKAGAPSVSLVTDIEERMPARLEQGG